MPSQRYNTSRKPNQDSPPCPLSRRPGRSSPRSLLGSDVFVFVAPPVFGRCLSSGPAVVPKARPTRSFACCVTPGADWGNCPLPPKSLPPALPPSSAGGSPLPFDGPCTLSLSGLQISLSYPGIS